MAGVVKSMDSALKSMHLEKVVLSDVATLCEYRDKTLEIGFSLALLGLFNYDFLLLPSSLLSSLLSFFFLSSFLLHPGCINHGPI